MLEVVLTAGAVAAVVGAALWTLLRRGSVAHRAREGEADGAPPGDG